MNKGLRLWRTVRWLKFEQIVGRAWFRLHRPRVETGPPPPVGAPTASWTKCHRPSSMTGAQTLTVLGEEHEISTPGDWNRAEWPKLWLYNAHYFNDLVAVDAPERAAWHRGLIARWVAENSPAHGVGWEPYPTSLRIVNWIKWSWGGNQLDGLGTHSLAVQVRWLRKRLERHLLGNHLWANAKALVFAGAFFEGEEAGVWLRTGLSLIDRELEEQVLADGGHFELSPMYHAIFVEDLLDLVQLCQLRPGVVAQDRCSHWKPTALRMLEWLRVMTHPDGDIAFFNDATLGVAPTHATLQDYAVSLGLSPTDAAFAPLVSLTDSGYARAHGGEATLLVDVGAVGPDYLPGHAHADTLSFELSLGRERVLVNSGVSHYEADPDRLRQRGTGAHNTLRLDQSDSSEVWSSFRVGRRARVSGTSSEASGSRVRIAAAHDGYAWRPGRPMHRREWILSARDLTVSDSISGVFESAEVRFHLHPDWSLFVQDGTHGWLEGPGRRVRWQVNGDAIARECPGTWHPGFGEVVPNQVLSVALREGRLDTIFSWE